MPVKIYFNDEIHRLTKLPDNLQALNETVIHTFKSGLTSSWTTSYINQEGEEPVITCDKDYIELLDIELSDPTATLKIKIVLAPEESIEQTPELISRVEWSASNESSSSRNGDKSEPLSSSDCDLTPSSERSSYSSQTEMTESRQRENLEQTKLLSDTILNQKNQEEDVKDRSWISDQQDDISLSLFESTIKEEDYKANISNLDDLQSDFLQSQELSGLHRHQRTLVVNGKLVHFYVKCEGCGITPIVGVRYKCGVCPDFNFCEACEDTNSHNHALLKIKTLDVAEDEVSRKRYMSNSGSLKSGAHENNEEEEKSSKDNERDLNGFTWAELNLFKNMQNFKEMARALKTRDIPKLEECRAKFEAEMPEMKILLDPVFQAVTRGEDSTKIKLAVKNLRKQLVMLYCHNGYWCFFKRLRQWKTLQKDNKPEHGFVKWIKGFFFGKKSSTEGLQDSTIQAH